MNIIQNLSGQVNAALLNELTALKAQLAAVEQEHQDVLRVLQRRQPEGSPPPGGSARLAEWILQSLETDLAAAEDALRRHGYRKSCDIAACNCGDQWNHGGHARERLHEISEALPWANGPTILQRVKDLVQERDTLRALVLKLPVVEGEILTNGEAWWVRREDGDYPVPEIPFAPIAALLDYRRGG